MVTPGSRSLAVLGLAAALAAVPLRPAAAEYALGVVPQFEQRKLHEIWRPIADELERRTGLAIKLNTTLKVSEFEAEFQRGAFDLVYMNPYFVAKTSKTLGYVPLLKDAVPMRGILVVLKGGPFSRPEQLAGKRVAFPTPNAPVGCMLLRAELKQKVGIDVEPVWARTAANVYLQVAKGMVDAGGAPDKTLQAQAPEIRDLLQVVYTTQPMAPHPIAVHPRVPAGDREKLRAALLALAETPEGRALLARIPMKEPVAATAEEYAALASRGLDAWFDPAWQGD
jgi:phosphonate transport system substrate-binding protein